MAEVVVTREDPSGWEEILHDPEVRAYLEAKAAEFVGVAEGIFAASSKHEDTPPVLYPASFFIDQTSDGVRVGNNDRTAEWVEFGAHADGKTPVLRYRVLGRTLDVLESREPP